MIIIIIKRVINQIYNGLKFFFMRERVSISFHNNNSIFSSCNDDDDDDAMRKSKKKFFFAVDFKIKTKYNNSSL